MHMGSNDMKNTKKKPKNTQKTGKTQKKGGEAKKKHVFSHLMGGLGGYLA